MADQFNVLDMANLSLIQNLGLDPAARVEAAPRWAQTSGLTVNSGTLVGCFLRPIQQLRVSRLLTCTRATAGVGSTLQRMGLYSWDGTNLTLLARTANDTAIWTATFAEYAIPLDTTGGYPADYLMVPGTTYGIAALTVGASTAPQLTTFFQNSSAATGARSPVLGFQINSQADLPAGPIAPTTVNMGNIPWGAAAV